jgi:uncharacterized membrane protein
MGAPRAVFLALGGLFGLFFALATPPHDPPDEARHHARAWLLSEGRLAVVGEAPGHGASLPRDITQLHPPGHHFSAEQVQRGGPASRLGRTGPHAPAARLEELRGSLARWELQPVRFLTPYNPVVYAPFVPALWISRGLELSAAAGLLLARLFGLATWLAGVWLVLRVAPCQRPLLAAVALLPLSVFQAASVSADPVTQLACFWLFAEWLRAVTAPDGPRPAWDDVRLLAAAAGLGLVKPGYAPLALACAALPGTLRRRATLGGAALAAAALPTLAWAAVARAAREPAVVPGVDPDAQLRFVLENPLAFLRAAADTVAGLLPRWLEGLVGNLGHFDVEIPVLATALGLAAVAVSGSLERFPLGAGRRLLLLGACLASGTALLFLAYLTWAGVGAERIPGVQGRYFLPLLPFALVALPRIPRVSERTLGSLVAASLAVVLTVSAAAMLRAYYAG